MENRKFAIPIACSFALHALFILGFNDPTTPPAPPPKSGMRPVVLNPTPPPEEPYVAPAGDTDDQRMEVEEKPIKGSPRPEQEEMILIPGPTDIPIDAGPTTTNPPDITPTITNGGVPGGEDDGKHTGRFGPSRIIDSNLLDRLPRTRFQPGPSYPYDARHQDLSGSVIVEFVVNIKGEVTHVSVISSSARTFEEPALRAVSRWLFEPGLRDGKPVSFRMRQPISFNLNSD